MDDEEVDEEAESALRVRLLRDTTRGKTAGYLPGLFQLRLRGNPQGGRFDPVRVHDLPLRSYDSAPGDQRWRLRVGDVVLQLNDRRINSFRTLDAVLEYIRKQERTLTLHISATRRGEELAGIPRRIRNAQKIHHVEAFLVQALASLYKRPAVTPEERRHAAAAGEKWSSRRSCVNLFPLGPGGWYDTLEVRVRKLFSVHAPRQHYLDGAGGGGAAVDGTGARRRPPYQPLAFGGGIAKLAPGAAAPGAHDGLHMYPSRTIRAAPTRRAPLASSGRQQQLMQLDAQAFGGGFGGVGSGLNAMVRQGASGDGVAGAFSDAAGSLGAILRQEETLWLELRSVQAGCQHESAALPMGSASNGFAVDLREDVYMPVLPFGDKLKVTLWAGKQRLINAGRGGALAVGKSKEREVGSGMLDVSFIEMKEAMWRDFPNVALLAPNGGEVVGYLHLKLNYHTHSNLGRYDAAANIQSHFRGLLLRRREVKRHEDAQRKQKNEARVRKKEEEKRRALVATYVQRRWRRNRPKQQQILRQLSAFVEHDRALLRKPLRVCVESIETHDVHLPWGGRLLLFGDLDAIHSLQLLHRPPRDVFYRTYAALRRGAHDVSAVGMAIPRWCSEALTHESAADALIERQRRAIALQRQAEKGGARAVGEGVVDLATRSPVQGGAPRAAADGSGVDAADQPVHESAYAALAVGEALPLLKVVGVEVHNYSEVRLKLALAADWLPTSAAACELILQAHSSAAMLVWLELLKIGIRGAWKVEGVQVPTGRRTVRPLPRQRHAPAVLPAAGLGAEDAVPVGAAGSPPRTPLLLPPPRNGRGHDDMAAGVDEEGRPEEASEQAPAAASRFGHRFLVKRLPDFLRNSRSNLRRLSGSVARRWNRSSTVE